MDLLCFLLHNVGLTEQINGKTLHLKLKCMHSFMFLPDLFLLLSLFQTPERDGEGSLDFFPMSSVIESIYYFMHFNNSQKEESL